MKHVVVGSSGSSDNFELFRDHVKSNFSKKSNKISTDEVLSNHTYNLNERYRGRNSGAIFDVLVGMAYNDKPSTLTYINSYGLLILKRISSSWQRHKIRQGILGKDME
jgi:hypothetical protein